MSEAGYVAVPASTDSPLLFLCDHASNRLPDFYGSLGLNPELFDTHIAHDIGAAEVTRALAAAYGAAALLGGWSRLLVDLNRGADDPTIVMKLSDGSIIPGNRHADAAEVARRIAAYHAPYHDAITREIARIQNLHSPASPAREALVGEVPVAGPRASEGRRGVPILVSMHSFTPSWKGVPRRWETGVLWDRDGRLARPLMARLAEAGFSVGDNEPYHGALEGDTLNRHGTRRGLPHVLIEMRQDLIADPASARAFAMRLKPILDAALSDMGPVAIELPP